MKKKLVVLTGAGISAESGLRTFRDEDGLWNGYRLEEVATPRAWKRDPVMVLNFYNWRRKEVIAAEPNAAHKGLAALQEHFDIHIITQNIDDLHERAGSTQVLHLHGEIRKMRSELDDSMLYDCPNDIVLGDKAMHDNGQLRPHVVWFEEPVPMIERAISITESADIFVVIGTSLQVYPAAGLLQYAPQNASLFIVDKKVPYIGAIAHLTAIQATATEGIVQLKEILLNDLSKQE